MQNEVVGLDEMLDPEYTDKDFLGLAGEYGEDILFSFTPNYATDIPVGTATVYGTPKILAEYQFEYFRRKNEILSKSDERISLRVYMLTGDICGEAKDVAAFQLAYEKLLEKATEKEAEQKNEVTETENNVDETLNKLAEEIFEEPVQPKTNADVKRLANYLGLPENSTFAEVKKEFEVNGKNILPPVYADYYEEELGKMERGEFK